jgi:2-polyprenyl-3-methyl-5-hydroxy-6-metoxy-1,4-benzoquinol methylase
MTTTTTTTTTTPAIDEAKVEEFVGQVLTDVSGMTSTILASIGDRLGLWKDLAANGPSTSTDLARRTGVNERYAREWLGGMASASYVEYDPASKCFTLPAEHAPALSEEGGAMFFGGAYQMMLGTLSVYDRVLEVFRSGGGVHQREYADDMWDGLERFTIGWFNHHLVQDWVPIVPGLQAKLEVGADVADVGTGRGWAPIRLAEAFPKSRYVGFDVFEPTIAKARAHAEESGVSDRVRFEARDVSKSLPEKYDVITTFDVVHDAVDPRGVLGNIKDALKADGIYVCLDINCSDKLEENAGPLGAFFHGASVMYCMTTSLANDGEGLGTLGLHPHKLDELAREAGFTDIWQAPLENPFNNLYALRA